MIWINIWLIILTEKKGCDKMKNVKGGKEMQVVKTTINIKSEY